MKVMISQPMKGRQDSEIKEERNKIISKFEKMHIDVIDTLFNDNVTGMDKPDVYLLSKSIGSMVEADAVYFVDGWREARGCRIEHEICKEYGIKCLYPDFFETDTMKECVSAPTTSITIGNSHILGNGLRGSNSDITY